METYVNTPFTKQHSYKMKTTQKQEIKKVGVKSQQNNSHNAKAPVSKASRQGFHFFVFLVALKPHVTYIRELFKSNPEFVQQLKYTYCAG